MDTRLIVAYADPSRAPKTVYHRHDFEELSPGCLVKNEDDGTEYTITAAQEREVGKNEDGEPIMDVVVTMEPNAGGDAIELRRWNWEEHLYSWAKLREPLPELIRG